MNHCAAPPLRVDGELPAQDLQALLHAGQAEPGPSHRLVGVKAGARVLDDQGDRVDLAVQGDVGVSRHAMFDGILQGFLQNAVEAERDFRGQRCRDVLAMNVNRHSMPIGQLFAEPNHRTFEPDVFQLRRVKIV